MSISCCWRWAVTEDRSPATAEERFQVTRKVTLVGALVNLLLAAGKILVGLFAHSQALVADGLHSLSDLISDGLVYYAAHNARVGPDSDHPYGHGRFETAATLGLGLLLGLVALGVAWDAVQRLLNPEGLLIPEPLALYIAALSILANEGLYHYTLRSALKINSEMLKANAWHHRSDAASSIVVFIGVGGSLIGYHWLDAVGALVVAMMIARVGWGLAGPALQELVDAGLDEGKLLQIHETIMAVNGVSDVHMLRTRKLGHEAAVDVHLLVNPDISVSEGHMIGQRVIDSLQNEIAEISDVTVHIDPEDDEANAPCRDLPLRDEAERLLAQQWADYPLAQQRERVTLHYLDGGIDVEVLFPLSVLSEGEDPETIRSRLTELLEAQPEFRQIDTLFR
ncbi:MAG: cation transporter [Gammaproteobacteria bacterium]|nr:cation transporter [Gammaproteobacteria bacterium]